MEKRRNSHMHSSRRTLLLMEAMGLENKSLILEVYKGSHGLKINESQTGVPEGMMRVTGVFAKVGVKNRNGRIYDPNNYRKHIELLKEQIPEGLYGELEHPEGFTVDLNNASHKIEALWFVEETGEVMGTLLLLDTPKGKIAQSIIKSGGILRVSSRATGTVDQNSRAFIDDLVTFDIVGTPGFKETRLQISENLVLTMRKFGSDALHESYVANIHIINNNGSTNNEHKMTTKRKPIQTKSIMEKKDNKKNKPSMLERKLSRIVDMRVQKILKESYTPVLEKWLNENYASVFQNWAIEDMLPAFSRYQRLSMNEKFQKKYPTFATYAKRLMEQEEKAAAEEAEKTDKKDDKKVDECGDKGGKKKPVNEKKKAGTKSRMNEEEELKEEDEKDDELELTEEEQAELEQALAEEENSEEDNDDINEDDDENLEDDDDINEDDDQDADDDINEDDEDIEDNEDILDEDEDEDKQDDVVNEAKRTLRSQRSLLENVNKALATYSKKK